MPPDNQNPYDFILQDRPKAKRQVLPKGSSTKSRAVIFAGSALVSLLLVVLIFGLLSKSGSANADKLISAAQDQAEILRVAGTGVDKAQSRDTKALAVTAQLSMQTDQATLKTALKKVGVKVSDKQLVSSQASQDDSVLSSADQAGNFDSAFNALIKQLITKYQQDLRLPYTGSGVNTRNTLNSLYTNAQTLISSK